MNSDLSISSEDFERLFGNSSFLSDTNSAEEDLDSSDWMQKIDVTSFQRLASEDLDRNLSQEIIASVDLDVFDEQVSVPRKSSGTGFPLKKRRNAASSNKRRSRKQNISSLQEDDEGLAVVSKRPRIKRRRQSPKLSNFKPSDGARYPKPVYSYSSLIGLALKNSQSGRMHVAEIYSFICDAFPFFRTASSGWKNSIRHNLSLNKCFSKIVVLTPDDCSGRSYCLWELCQDKMEKIDSEIKRSREKHPEAARKAYANPGDLDEIERGLKRIPPTRVCHHTAKAAKAAKQKKLHEGILDGFKHKATGLKSFLRQSEKTEVPVQKIHYADAKLAQSTGCNKGRRYQNQLVVSRPIAVTPNRGSTSTPPPASFSTPNRGAPCEPELNFSPIFVPNGYNEPHDLWQHQNYQTPRRRLCLLNDESFSEHSSIFGSPDDKGNPSGSPCYTKRLQVKFATALESAFSASSPHNNSLIKAVHDFH